MLALLPLFNLLADDPTYHGEWHWFQILIDVLGGIGLVVLLVIIILMITMIPDFIRYLKIKAM